MKKIAVWLTGVLLCAHVWADESIGLEFPVEDARQEVSANRFVFVGIEFADGIELTGLDSEQTEIVKSEYQVRALNKRWQSYGNIEDRPEELARMRGYALRYNLEMWAGIKEQKLKNFKRYRY